MPKATPRPFSGEVDLQGVSEEPATWLKHFNLVAQQNGWDDGPKKLQNLPIYLTGEAEQWYDVHGDEIVTEKWSWKTFEE